MEETETRSYAGLSDHRISR